MTKLLSLNAAEVLKDTYLETRHRQKQNKSLKMDQDKKTSKNWMHDGNKLLGFISLFKIPFMSFENLHISEASVDSQGRRGGEGRGRWGAAFKGCTAAWWKGKDVSCHPTICTWPQRATHQLWPANWSCSRSYQSYCSKPPRFLLLFTTPEVCPFKWHIPHTREHESIHFSTISSFSKSRSPTAIR